MKTRFLFFWPGLAVVALLLCTAGCQKAPSLTLASSSDLVVEAGGGTATLTFTTYISACLNGQAGKNFPEFVNDYRLRCAQQLMTTNPDMLLAEVAEESGFSNEQSFFRTFKARTGLTPQEWKATI